MPTREEKLALLEMLEEKARRESRRYFYTLFPDGGPLRRELYPRHLRFFELGKDFKTRAFIAANRTGKTEGGGGYETACHLAGIYPDWWPGIRWTRPIEAWVAGDTMETTRDIIQAKLLGPKGSEGTGLIPGDRILKIQYRPNAGGAADFALIAREGGGTSHLAFKSYDQGRRSFQGTEKDLIWLDEESEEGIRAECVMRLMTTGGHLIETFTPLKGLTPIVLKYIGETASTDERETATEDRVMVMAGWDDVPHLGAAEKKRMLAESEPHLREARSKGIPSIGAGAIYPLPEAEIVVAPFEIPAYWPRAYGLDVGWNRTAAVWGAIDRQAGVSYLYSEHYRGQAEPAIHAQAIKARGAWVPGVIDPAARGRAQADGKKLLVTYQSLGLDINTADNAVETGLQDVWTDLSSGRLKVFSTLQHWLAEYRVYRRDEKGRIVKKNDHLMDATRYLRRSGFAEAKVYRPTTSELSMRVPDHISGDQAVGY